VNCPHCGKEIASDEAVPKAYLRKILNGVIDNAENTDDKLRAVDLLSRLEQYTGSGIKGDQRKLGVQIVQHSMVKGPEKPKE
jgi:hypothetical protein